MSYSIVVKQRAPESIPKSDRQSIITPTKQQLNYLKNNHFVHHNEINFYVLGKAQCSEIAMLNITYKFIDNH